MVAGYMQFTPFTELRRQMNQLFENYGFGRLGPPLAAAAYPLLNVCDEGDALSVEAELPGVKRDDLEVFALGNELTIKGRWQSHEGDGTTHHRQERPVGEFSRVLTLPVEVNADKVEAHLSNGVLSIRLPKAESAKPRRISLKS
jgi:HSP20 family protein